MQITAKDREFVQIFIQNLTREMVDHINRELQLKIPFPEIRYSFSPRFGNSTGGTRLWKPRMSLGLYSSFGSSRFSEYEHIRDDPEIGTVSGYQLDGWKHHVALLVAHEFAHCVEHTTQLAYKPQQIVVPANSYYDTSVIAKDQQKSHGPCWQYLYRLLRNRFVNNGYYKQIEVCVPVRREYIRNTELIGRVRIHQGVYLRRLIQNLEFDMVKDFQIHSTAGGIDHNTPVKRDGFVTVMARVRGENKKIRINVFEHDFDVVSD